MIEKVQEVIDEVEANLEFTPLSAKERQASGDERISGYHKQPAVRQNTDHMLAISRQSSLRISDNLEGGEPEEAIVELQRTETLETARSTRRLVPLDGAKDDKEEYIDTKALKRK